MVSVIIPIYNEEKTIGTFLKTLEPVKGKAEIIFVDGGSTDATLSLIPEDYRVLKSPKGRARQMNLGADKSRGDVLFFLHCDSEIPQDILKKTLDDLEEYDIVINPTIDGGYYLIGMTKEHEKVWRIEHYGTNTVIHNTLKQLKAEGLKTKVGRVCRDIDTKEDLKALYKEFGKLPTGSVPVHTGNYLKSDLKEKLEYADDRSGCAQYECG